MKERPPETRVVCAWCPRAFPTMPLLLDHIEEVHLPVLAAMVRAARLRDER